MRFSWAASLALVLGLMRPVSVSLFDLPEDLEGSGSDLEGSGSGHNVEMGDPSLSGELLTVETPEEGNKNTVKLSSGVASGNKRGPPPEFFAFGNNRSFGENRQFLAAQSITGCVAGGITGAALGATLSAILIYKWRKKHVEECSLGKKNVSDDNY